MSSSQVGEIAKSCFGFKTELHEQAVRAAINTLLADGYICKDENGVYHATKAGMAKLMQEALE